MQYRFSIELHKASENDVELLFTWANDKDVRENAINSEPIKWENHVKWFNNKINSNDTLIYIGFLNHIPIGQIRFDLENENYIIDYSVDKLFRGKGLGTQLIKKGIDMLKSSVTKPFIINAYVKPENMASVNAFENLQFIEIGTAHYNGVLLKTYKLKIE